MEGGRGVEGSDYVDTVNIAIMQKLLQIIGMWEKGGGVKGGDYVDTVNLAIMQKLVQIFGGGGGAGLFRHSYLAIVQRH